MLQGGIDGFFDREEVAEQAHGSLMHEYRESQKKEFLALYKKATEQDYVTDDMHLVAEALSKNSPHGEALVVEFFRSGRYRIFAKMAMFEGVITAKLLGLSELDLNSPS